MHALALLGLFPGEQLVLFALPLVVVVSLVYGATRHEAWPVIFRHAWDTAVWIVGFMGAVFVFILMMGWWL